MMFEDGTFGTCLKASGRWIKHLAHTTITAHDHIIPPR